MQPKCVDLSRLLRHQRGLVLLALFCCLFVAWFSRSTFWSSSFGHRTWKAAHQLTWVKIDWVQEEIYEAMNKSEEQLDNRAVSQHFQWSAPKSSVAELDEATHGIQSSFYVVNKRGKSKSYRVGDKLELRIVARNKKREKKRYGGDFWRVLLKSPDLKSSIHGKVTDNKDGTYSAIVPLMFPGPAVLTVSLIHSSEVVDKLRRMTSTRTSPGLQFEATIQAGGYESKQLCNTWLPALARTTGPRPCNLSSKTNGEPWFCDRPHAGCGTVKTYKALRNNDAQSVLDETGLFKMGSTLRVPVGQAKPIEVLPKYTQSSKQLPRCTVKDAGTASPVPAGYFLNDQWKSLHCASQSFADKRKEARCLRDKTLHILGDSTIRQWYGQFLLPGLLRPMKTLAQELLRLDRGVEAYEADGNKDPWEPREAYDPVNNVSFHFSAHGPPLQNGGPPSTMPYISDRIDSIRGGKETVVAITIGMHLLLYDPYVYVRRLRTIADSIRRLLKRAPDTLVVYKGLNTFTMDDMFPSACCLSEWLAYRYNEIARSVLGKLPVVFLDCWDMTVAHYSSSADLHPLAHIVESEVDLFLSYICPDEER